MTATSSSAPPWLDRSLYPFASRWHDTPDGRMHYVDEGAGSPVVLVHGTPTWSFLWRRLIARLAPRHRVVAPDHLGFGFSDKPADAPYAPSDHARRLTTLLDALDITGATLVVHDFGGPIGLASALARPERIARLVVFNTWMWSVAGEPKMAKGGKLFASPLGRFLYRHLNLSPRVIMPSAYADRRKLTPEIHRHYLAPLGSPDERMGAWSLARALLGASGWYESLWAQRDVLREKPMLLVWGMKDPAFGPAYLDRWRREFPAAEVHEIASSGHFVPEEAPDEIAPILERFVDAAAPGAAPVR